MVPVSTDNSTNISSNDNITMDESIKNLSGLASLGHSSMEIETSNSKEIFETDLLPDFSVPSETAAAHLRAASCWVFI